MRPSISVRAVSAVTAMLFTLLITLLTCASSDVLVA